MVLNISAVNEERFFITLHPKSFSSKEEYELGKITNWFKNSGHSEIYTALEILKFSAEGRCYIPSLIQLTHEIEGNTEGTASNFEFISSRLLFIDVDDDKKQTVPLNVLKTLKESCLGLYYTSSHQIKGNRYRLMFAFNRAIRSQIEYAKVQQQVTNMLRKMNIPADINPQDGLQRIRTAKKGYVVGNLNAVLNVDDLLADYDKENEFSQKQKLKEFSSYAKHEEYLIYSVAELKERATKIGYVENYTEWQNLAYSLKSYVQEGHITDEEGYEIFEILCGGSDETKFWMALKSNRMSIGTFIFKSNQAGFKRSFRYYHAISEKKSNYNIEQVKYNTHIEQKFAEKVLGDEENVLIKAPTGSGKTSTFIEAAKELAGDDQLPSRYYLFAVPTVAITEQTSVNHEILAIKGETDNMFKRLKNYSDSGKRVIVSTYDMTAVVIDLLKKVNPFMSFVIVVDEYHQFTHSYNYRRDAIDAIYQLKDRAKGFIGLSGTIEDILRDDFDKEYHLIQSKPLGPTWGAWGAITYNATLEEEVYLYQLLKQKASNGRKLLVFIQNIEFINRIHSMLSESKIRCAKIDANDKKMNNSYLTIVRESRFPNDIDVILTTSVLSDGINILNENNNYECIVVCSQQSQIFNPSLIRQMANRFRNPYRGFYLFMMKARKTSKYLYNIDEAYRYEKILAENVLDLLKSEFNVRGSYRLFRKSIIEKHFDIQVNENDEFSFNPLKLRLNVSDEKSRYYSIYREQFVQAVGVLMESKASQTIDFNEFIEKERFEGNSIDLTEQVDYLELIKSTKIEEIEDLEANIEIFFTPFVHKAFCENNEIVINAFRKVSSSVHFNALRKIAPITNFSVSLKLLKKTKRDNDAPFFIKRIESLIDIELDEKIHRKTATMKVVDEFKNHTGINLKNEEYKEIIAKISKKHKRAKRINVEKIAVTHFRCTRKKSNGERYVKLDLITPRIVADEYNLSLDELDEIRTNVIKSEELLMQQILLSGGLINNEQIKF